MNKSIYNNYFENISNSLKNGKKRGLINKSSLGENMFAFSANENELKWQDEKNNEINFNSLQQLNSIAGKKAKYHEKLGAHPKFSYLKEANKVEYHYITSMFIDIRNSTKLFQKYYPHTVANITTTIQSAAIHTCWYFDGYVQRLHGDGLLVYFGDRDMDIKTSTNNALNAAAFFSYFVKNDLKKLFDEQGIGNIYTRIGIDTGYKDDVMWHLAGMGDCSEITTCSLHTSLAAKMQSQAKSNGIIIGDNVAGNTVVGQDYFKHKKYVEDDTTSDYIYQISDDKFYYKQHEFNWEKYLNNHPQIEKDGNGNLFFKPENSAPNISVTKNLDYLKSNVQGYKPSFNM